MLAATTTLGTIMLVSSFLSVALGESPIGGRMLFAAPPRAMVLQLDSVRASSGGLRREVTVLASVEVHL